MEDLLGVAQGARELGLSQARLRELLAQHRLPARKIAGRWVMRRVDLPLLQRRPAGRPGRFTPVDNAMASRAGPTAATLPAPRASEQDRRHEQALQVREKNMHRSRVFAIVNRKGGSGKSTTTRNLASVLSHMGLQVVIGDLDPQASLTRLLVDELDRPGLGTCLLEPTYTARDCLIETPWNIAMLPGDRSIEQAAQMLATRPTGHQRLARVLGALEGFDVVLLDTPPSLGFALTSAVLAAGWAIMPTFTTQEDIDALLDTVGEMDELREGGLPCADLLAVVPNKLHRDSADQKGLALIKQLFGATVSSPIPHLAAIKHASNARLPLDVYDPHSPALAIYRELADKVCGAIDTASPREDLVRADA